MRREDEGVGDDDVLRAAGHEDDGLGDVLRGQGLAASMFLILLADI